MFKFSAFDAKSEVYLDQSREALDKLYQRKDLAYLNLANKQESIEHAKKIAAAIKEDFSELIVVGMGGSSLGAQAIHTALCYGNENLQVWNNTDPLVIAHKIKSIKNPEKCFWLFISKSGETVEVLAILQLIAAFLIGKNLDIAKQSMVLTQPSNSKLREWATENRIEIFDHDPMLGGRFSVLSPVGLIPAAFLGLDIDQFVKGAQSALKDHSNIFKLSNFILHGIEAEKSISVFWIYAERLQNFALWLQQLWAESLGKSRTRAGKKAKNVSMPSVCIGTRDQHSILQQFIEGPHDKSFIFFSEFTGDVIHKMVGHIDLPSLHHVQNLNLETIFHYQAQATQEAIYKEDHPVFNIHAIQLDEKSLGHLFMLWQIVIGCIGEALNIDAYDQPGVERAKLVQRKHLSKI